MSEHLAIIRVRGHIRVNFKVEDTMKMLNLHRKNYMAVYEKKPNILGMINKVKNYITYGEITPELYEEVKKKLSEPDPKDPKKIKKYFRLQPPRKGFGRKGIKKSYSIGGALGYRGVDINDLIKRMM